MKHLNDRFRPQLNFSVPAANSWQNFHMTSQGYLDHISIASRVKERFPTLLSNSSLIELQSTNTTRTIASGLSFILGLKLSDAEASDAVKRLYDSIVPLALDSDLQPRASCQKYISRFPCQNRTHVSKTCQYIYGSPISTHR